MNYLLALSLLASPDLITDTVHLSLIELVGPSEGKGSLYVTPAKRLKDFGEATEARFDLVHLRRLPRKHPYLLAPLIHEGKGRWRLQTSQRPCPVRRGAVRSVEPFVRQWRANSHASLTDRAVYWIGTATHPMACARRLAISALRRNADALGGLDPDTLRPLVNHLLLPGVAEREKIQLIRLLTILKGGGLLVDAFDQLSPPRVKMRAAGALARDGSPASRETLLRCAQSADPPIKHRCARLLARSAASDEGAPR